MIQIDEQTFDIIIMLAIAIYGYVLIELMFKVSSLKRQLKKLKHKVYKNEKSA